MSLPLRPSIPLLALLGAALAAHPSAAQDVFYPDHYEVASSAFGQLPGGRSYGAVSAIYPSPDGQSIWVAERCGANTCKGSSVDPILQFDLNGRLLRSFGAGMFVWPHGMHVDRQGNVWVTDAVGYGVDPEGKGHVVFKFSPEGELLMTLGRPGVAGDGPDTFNKPSDVLVAPDGSIFVADGHDATGNNRIVKLSAEGRFIKAWGTTGGDHGQFRDPHALAMDSKGRLFVGDRGNSRVQVFDQEGEHLATWTQFGRPSGLFIRDDALYSSDSESNSSRNPGWKRGIYVGSAATGWVHGLIRDPEPDQDNSGTSGAEGVAVDARGNVYGAEVGPETVKKYTKTAERERGELSFFITSRGSGNGADLGGLTGADQHCEQLAYAVGAGDLTWRAYLSAVPSAGQPGVNARDRIGEGPWYNAKGTLVARSVEELHADNNLTKQNSITERGDVVNGRGDQPNTHDILTGSTLDGRFLESGDDTTCGNWTKSGADGSALLGHHDRQGGGANPSSWNSAHASRGCGQENLRASGGDGLFYCFAADRRR